MKVEDLMIGDILIATHDDGEKVTTFPVVVDGIDENGSLVDGECYTSWKPLLNEHEDIEYADDLEPIPLTEDILKANGFNILYTNTTLLVEYDGYVVLTRNIKDSAYNFASYGHYKINIMYVHEFQHVLRLCGLKELADNFKVKLL